MLSATLALATVCAASFIPASASSTNTGFFGNVSPVKSDGTKNEVSLLPIEATYGIPKNGLLPQAKFIYTLHPEEVEAGTLASTGLDSSGDEVTVYSGTKLVADDLTKDWVIPSQYLENTQSTSTTLQTGSTFGIDLTALFATSGEDEIKTVATGVYRFTLSQTLYVDTEENADGYLWYKKNAAGTYDETKYRVDLYVQGSTAAVEKTDTTEAVPASPGYVYLVKVYKENIVKDDDGNITSDTWEKAEPKFENEIKVEDLIIKNYVENTVNDEDVGFTIALEILEGSDVVDGVTLKAGTDLNAYVQTKDGKIPCDGEEHNGRKFDPIVVQGTDDDGNVYDVNEFTLYSEEYLVVPGVPVNMKYTTWNTDTEDIPGYVNTYLDVIGKDTDGNDLDEPEKQNAESGFVSAVTTNDDEEETWLTVQRVILEGQNMIIYHNVNKDIVATGIAMESAPYVVMFLAAAAIAVLTVVKKKTNR
jgi:hypothetical protein